MSLSFRKKCAKCGKQFEARDRSHDLCPTCFRAKASETRGGGVTDWEEDRPRDARAGRGSRRPAMLGKECLLDSFYVGDDLRSELFRGIPQRIAETLEGAGMTRTSIRRFYNVVRRAYDRYRVDPKRRFGPSREMIESLEPLVAYSETREGGTPPCFSTFIKHYVGLTAREERNLRGFKYLFQSVVAFITRK